jgi:hypothetical protein
MPASSASLRCESPAATPPNTWDTTSAVNLIQA